VPKNFNANQPTHSTQLDAKTKTYHMVLRSEGLDEQNNALVKMVLDLEYWNIVLDGRLPIAILNKYHITWQFG
jgi:hypothetical protein